MIKTKLVTLTPMDSFFFGGEQTFGNGDKRNFYAESRFFPQQTSIIGVLRHVLFEADQQQNFGKSFMVGKANDFGWIKSISPVFIHSKNKTLGIPIRLPKNQIKEYPVQTKPVPLTQVNFGYGAQEAVVLDDFKEKYGTDKQLLLFDPLIPFDAVFKEVIKTGIARDRKKHTALEGMFYRQRLFKMADGYSFGVYVEAEEELFEWINQRNMPLGGEKVNFVLRTFDEGAFKIPDDLLRKHIKGEDWIFLVSDAYVPESIYEYCSLAMADAISFRNIVTPGAYTANLDLNLIPNSHKRYKSIKMALLQRGSILFPKGKDAHTEIIKLLDNQQLRAIGYNHFYSNFKTK